MKKCSKMAYLEENKAKENKRLAVLKPLILVTMSLFWSVKGSLQAQVLKSTKSNSELIMQYQSSWWDAGNDNATTMSRETKRLQNTRSQDLNDADRILQEVQFKTRQIVQQRQHIETWGLEKLPRYQDRQELQREDEKYITKRMLKYLEKRVLDPIKQEAEADKQNQKHIKSGKVMAYQALNPASALSFSKDFRLRFKAKPLQGKVFTDLVNPYLEVQLEASVNGRAILHIKKDVSVLGVSTFVDYHFRNQEVVAVVRKPLSNNINAEASSRKLPGFSDQRLMLSYGLGF